jgi:hypothetical protein
MNGWIVRWMDGQIDGRKMVGYIDGWIDEWMKR